jgi:hypothetical protein
MIDFNELARIRKEIRKILEMTSSCSPQVISREDLLVRLFEEEISKDDLSRKTR